MDEYFDRKGNPITIERARELIKQVRLRTVGIHKVAQYVVCTIHLVVKEVNPKTKEKTALFKTDIKSREGIHWFEFHDNLRQAIAGHDKALELTKRRIVSDG